MRRRPRSALAGPRQAGSLAAWLLVGLLTATSTLHLLAPGGFEAIVPRFLGDPSAWVRGSGVAELGCAVAIAVSASRRVGALGAAVLFVGVFPANIQLALDSGGSGHGLLHNPLIAWGRLPLQIPLILWALFVARSARTPQAA